MSNNGCLLGLFSRSLWCEKWNTGDIFTQQVVLYSRHGHVSIKHTRDLICTLLSVIWKPTKHIKCSHSKKHFFLIQSFSSHKPETELQTKTMRSIGQSCLLFLHVCFTSTLEHRAASSDSKVPDVPERGSKMTILGNISLGNLESWESSESSNTRISKHILSSPILCGQAMPLENIRNK
jgi:hypothetical protein